jgi:hypothetical protein
MIHVNSITNSLFLLVASDSTLVNSAVKVETLVPFNDKPTLTPWVGVYDGDFTLEPFTIGGNQPWKAQLELNIFVQTMNDRDAVTANNQLFELQNQVMSIVNSNKTLGGTVEMITELSSKPFQRDMDTSWRCYANQITIKANVRG